MNHSFPSKNCTGCTACASICAKGCISMQEDAKGFVYPVIDESLCVDCGTCTKVCPALYPSQTGNIDNLLLAKHRDESIRQNSSSGGCFTAAATWVVKHQGVVFGAAFDEHWDVIHDYTETVEGIERFRGSKYVQSRLGNTFITVRDFLRTGRLVLFTGTPCQVTGLLHYLKQPYDNLITMDFICHGVPSPKTWQQYLCDEIARQCEKNTVSLSPIPPLPGADTTPQTTSIRGIRFRDKALGWKKFSFALSLSKATAAGKKNSVSLSVNAWEHPFMKGFLYNLFLRPSCYHCPVKNFSSGSDLTMADGWGIENYLPEWNDDKGISLLVPHTAKGDNLVNQLRDIELCAVDASILTCHNEAAFYSPKPHRYSSRFYQLTNKQGLSFHEIIQRCFPPTSYWDKLMWSVDKRLEKLKKKKVRVLIVGTGSLLNYGCEAIVQGTYSILKHIWPDCDITVASDDIGYDRQILPADIHLITYKRRFSPYRIYRGILRRVFRIGNGSEVRMKTDIAKGYDLVLSAGGDNYCETPEGSIYSLLVDLMKVGDVAVANRRKYVLWGASVGPFRKKENCERVAANLHTCSLITVREELSYRYVKEVMECSQVRLVADPAFCMKPDMSFDFPKEEGFVYIGLNLSELSVSHCIPAEQKSSFIKALFLQLDDILERNLKYRYVCIPHVMTDQGVQNDIVFMSQYLAATKHSERVGILPAKLGARKTKAIISRMDLLVAARMHCCVGGISTSTPTLFITYSNKGIGMSGYAYGHHQYELPVASLTCEAFPRLVDRMISERADIKHYLQQQQARFTGDAMRAGNNLIPLFV